jgi:3-hydroxymyristoyl/3-hydroxydecanoyl-(acyl carrier protein) dehydratase
VLELRDCFGAMLPVADFDDPEALRARCELLCGAGAPPRRFRGVPAPDLAAPGGEPGRSATATLRVPAAAPFFADHFPRRPVYPATLLLDAQMRVAQGLLAQAAPGRRYAPTRMTRVKVRAFTPPGGQLELGAALESLADGRASLALTASNDGRMVATAKLEVVAEAA